MARTNKITAKKIIEAVGAKDKTPVTIKLGEGETEIEIVVKTFLPLADRVRLVSDIADMVFDTSVNSTGVYVPAFFDFALAYEVVSYLTNIAIPEDIEDAWLFFESTDIINTMINQSPAICDLIAELAEEAENLIEYRKSLVEPESTLNGVLSSLTNVIDAIKDKFDGMAPEDIMEELKGLLGDNVADLNKEAKPTA